MIEEVIDASKCAHQPEESKEMKRQKRRRHKKSADPKVQAIQSWLARTRGCSRVFQLDKAIQEAERQLKSQSPSSP